MGSFHEKDIRDIIEDSHNYAKPLEIMCPKVTCMVEMDGKKQKKTYHDITDVFSDYEEGKVMGRIWHFER